MAEIKYSETLVFADYEPSDWECELFGTGAYGIKVRPEKGKVPNVFWRWMQFILLGNKWKRIK